MKTIVGSKATSDWSKVRIGDVLRLTNGRAFKPSEWREQGLPIVRIQNLNNAEAPFNYFEGDLPEKFLLNNGDLLFAWSGTPGTSFGAHIWRGGKAWLNQHIFKVTFDEADFDKKFLQLAINQNLNEYIRAAHGGAGLAHITKGRFEQSELVKPTLDEQRDIVAEIEKQFSRLDEAIVNLKHVKANLKRYRAAVLKAAVEGKLTEDWRKQHPNIEPASTLLERILAERRVKWSGRGKYKEPAQPETDSIKPLPNLWILVSVDQLSSLVTDGDHNPPKRVSEGVPHLTAKHIKGWRISFEDCSYVSLLDYERTRSRFEPQPGDFIVTCVGTVGQTAIVPAGITFSADRNLAGIRLVECGMTPKFLQIVLNSPEWQLRMRQASGSTAQPHLYLGDLRILPIPLPPLPEQEKIIEEVERRLSVIEEIQATVEANLTRADRLRQSILSGAFAGRLFTREMLPTHSERQSVSWDNTNFC